MTDTDKLATELRAGLEGVTPSEPLALVCVPSEITALLDERDALKAENARLREATKPKTDAVEFDSADWFYRVMDPDDSGDSPQEALNIGMVGTFCVCEVASSFQGPTRFGFIAPVMDPESDDEEFVHFATQEEAVSAAAARRAALGGAA